MDYLRPIMYLLQLSELRTTVKLCFTRLMEEVQLAKVYQVLKQRNSYIN